MLESSKQTLVQQFLRARRLGYVEVVQRPNDSLEFDLFVPGDRITDQAGRGLTSYRQMQLVKRHLQEALNISVDWIIKESELETVFATALKHAFETEFPGVVDGITLSLPRVSPFYIWVQSTSTAIRPTEQAMEITARKVSSLFGLGAPNVSYANPIDGPSNGLILKVVKIGAPIDPKNVAAEVIKLGRKTDETQIERQMEVLRQRGILVRNKSGTYALTEKGIGMIPRSVNRNSSDIERLLAISRRQW